MCVHQAIYGYGTQDALSFRSVKEGELFFIEDRDINLVELALATNIPKGCAETLVRGMTRCTSQTTDASWFKSLNQEVSSTINFSSFLLTSVNVSYLDGKGNLEPQGTGQTLLWYWMFSTCWNMQFVQIRHKHSSSCWSPYKALWHVSLKHLDCIQRK